MGCPRGEENFESMPRGCSTLNSNAAGFRNQRAPNFTSCKAGTFSHMSSNVFKWGFLRPFYGLHNALFYLAFPVSTYDLPCPQTNVELLELGHEGKSQKTEIIKMKNFVFWSSSNILEWGDKEVFKSFPGFILRLSHD